MKCSAQLVVAAALLAASAMVLMTAPAPAGAQAARCDALQLSPCAAAIIGAAAPSATCCSRLKAQQPCMCQYARSPILRAYVDTPEAKKVMAACKVSVPSC